MGRDRTKPEWRDDLPRLYAIFPNEVGRRPVRRSDWIGDKSFVLPGGHQAYGCGHCARFILLAPGPVFEPPAVGDERKAILLCSRYCHGHNELARFR